MPPDDATRRALVARLESLRQAGVTQLPKTARHSATQKAPEPKLASTSNARKAICEVPRPSEPTSTTASGNAMSGIEELPAERNNLVNAWCTAGSQLFDDNTVNTEFSNVHTLESLRQLVAGCTRCGELARTRTQTVFGVGNAKARLCFLGEAPGADEDRLGEPFVGRGGQLLNKIIEACHLKREEIYILNMIKCRPPGNRNPLPTELSNCRGYLDRQLGLIQPEFICCLGAVASQNLLNTTVAIGKLRGRIHQYRGAKVVCTYHPAFLLRSPSFKKETWEDMKMLLREMGVNLGESSG